MELLGAIQNALKGKGGFTLYQQNTRIPPPKPGLFSAHKKQPVLWPLGNDAKSLWAFLAALGDGVIPLVFPKNWPLKKQDRLRKAFPGFGFFNGKTIDPSPVPVTVDKDFLFAILTSGSTGIPKAVAAREEQVVVSIRAMEEAQGLSKIKSTATVIPLAYAYAMNNQLLWAVLNGRKVTALGSLAMAADALGHIHTSRTEMVCMVASQAEHLKQIGADTDLAIPHVRIVNFGGSPFPVNHFPALQTLFPNARFFNNYGCTEALPRLTVTRVRNENHSVTDVGCPIPGLELRIKPPAPGPIQFKGPSTSLGYLETDGNVTPHGKWIDSGDAGFMEGNRLQLLGRRDQISTINGERISLMEIETLLLTFPFKRALVWCEKDSNGQRILGVVSGNTPVEKRQLGRWLKENVYRPAWPSAIYQAHPWPQLNNGKTDRVTLKSLALSGQLPAIWS